MCVIYCLSIKDLRKSDAGVAECLLKNQVENEDLKKQKYMRTVE